MKVAHNKKVFVGLSGGVDSSVSAALLKREGFEVTGVFIKAWYPDFFTCTWKDERRDAMRVCAALDIPFITLDLEKEYKRDVVDHMLAEYEAGRTPNPDVMCNKAIKFGGFFDFARKAGADFIATGHYARVKEAKDATGQVMYKLLEGKDPNKDQSYFLWTLSQDHLAHTLFPVGDLEKSKVRKLAEEFDLPTFAKKDSQGLCFMGKVDLKEFLGHYLKTGKGKVLDEKGKVVGEHDGAWLYTLGERHGFTIAVHSHEERPYYVVAKNIEDNTITVSHKSLDTDTLKPTQKITLTNLHWITEAPAVTDEITVRIRYRQEPEKCKVVTKGKTSFIEFKRSQSVISPGQSAVFYRVDECLGGAIIG